MKRIAHDGSALLGSALILAGSVVSAGCSGSHRSSGGAGSPPDDGGAGVNTPACSAATCAGTCTSGRCWVTLSTPPNYPVDAFFMRLGQTALYWLDAQGYVMRVPTAGGDATTIASTTGPGAAGQLTGLAVDADHVYWSAGLSPDGGYIAQAPASGGPVTTIASGLNSPDQLATDGTNVYWATSWYAIPNISLLSMPVGGGTLATLWSSNPNASSVEMLTSLFYTRGQVYWTTGDGKVLTVPASGGTPRQLAYEETLGRAVVADSAAAYWTNTAGNVERLPLDGGAPTVLASGQTPTHDLAIDETSLYWMNYPTGTDQSGGIAVMKVPLDGGALTTIASGDGGTYFFGVAADDTSLYLLVGKQSSLDASAGQAMSVVKVTPK
jgi:hypothetical protein